MKLFVYDHCPYCIKVRVITGLKNLSCELVFVANDEEKLLIDMIGSKMVPILEYTDANNQTKYMPESLDIIRFLDGLDNSPKLINQSNAKLDSIVTTINPILYKLCMPRWVLAPLAEFSTDSVKKYFINKKSSYIGDFAENISHTAQLIQQIQPFMQDLENIIKQHVFLENNNISLSDIHLFASLRSLSIVKALNMPHHLKEYAIKMSHTTKINLHDDIAI